MARLREWLVIESSRKNAPFSTAEDKVPRGYSPREAVEAILGRSIREGTEFFDIKTCEAMRAHPEWRMSLAQIDADCVTSELAEREAMLEVMD